MSTNKLYRPLAAPFLDISDLKVVSSALYLNCFTAPVTIVSAPPAGKALIFSGAVLHKPAGTAYVGANNISIKYTDASGLEVSQIAVSGFMDQTTVQTRFARPHTAASGANSITPVAASPLVLQVLVANPTTGTGGLRLRVWYKIVPMVP